MCADALIKMKVPKEPEIESEMQQGVFNDVNEIGTSKKKKRKRAPRKT
jgi:hypothetical protein